MKNILIIKKASRVKNLLKSREEYINYQTVSRVKNIIKSREEYIEPKMITIINLEEPAREN